MSTFSYFTEDDALEYDVQAAKQALGSLEQDLYSIQGKLSTLVSHLSDLQDHCHDKEGTNIAEDYKDFAALIGDDASGINGYMLDATDLVTGIYDTVTEWERITNK